MNRTKVGREISWKITRQPGPGSLHMFKRKYVLCYVMGFGATRGARKRLRKRQSATPALDFDQFERGFRLLEGALVFTTIKNF